MKMASKVWKYNQNSVYRCTDDDHWLNQLNKGQWWKPISKSREPTIEVYKSQVINSFLVNFLDNELASIRSDPLEGGY